MIGLYFLLAMFSFFFLMEELLFCCVEKSLSVSADIVKKYVIEENKNGTFSVRQQNCFCFIPIKQYMKITYFNGDYWYPTFLEAKTALDKHLYKPKKEISKVHAYKKTTPKPEKL